MDNETLFEVFKKAILNEHNAYEFYLKAAKETGNPEARRLFENFAATELGHRTELEELYKNLKK
jgi:rubrerythrin